MHVTMFGSPNPRPYKNAPSTLLGSTSALQRSAALPVSRLGATESRAGCGKVCTPPIGITVRGGGGGGGSGGITNRIAAALQPPHYAGRARPAPDPLQC